MSNWCSGGRRRLDLVQGLGIIGVGAMGGAIARRISASRNLPGSMSCGTIVLADKRQEHVATLAQELGLGWLEVQAIPGAVDTIIIAVKPQDMEQVLADLSPGLSPDHLLISLAAGVSLANLAFWTSPQQSIVRVMPNTPCLIGQGAVVCSPNAHVSPAQLRTAQDLFAVTGKVWVLPEQQLDAVTAVSGSGPAYIYVFLEALIDGGVTAGLSYQVAAELAVQTILGATQMVAETGKHPAVLKNMVTSPAGTTAAALRELEAGKLRSVVIEAVLAAAARSQALQKSKPEGGNP